jgi:putative sterol carrier protein
MAGKRSYGDACGIARALDLVGERWALMVVRELLLGPKRFTDIRAGLPHVSPDVLAQRLIELGRWGGANAPPPSDDMCMSLDAHLVSLRTLFDPRRAGDFTARIELRLGDERFRVAIADGEIEAGRGELPDADAMIETDPTTLIEVLHGHRPLAEALAAGTMRLSGDRRLARRFTQLFPLPARAVV